jgi:hypothetical protein
VSAPLHPDGRKKGRPARSETASQPTTVTKGKEPKVVATLKEGR